MENETTIQRRLEAQALEVPGLAGHPQIKPLIKWVSNALAGLHAEMDAARADLYHCMIDRIFPEPESRAFPAHAIAQVRPEEPAYECSTDWCRNVDKTTAYFSPIQPAKVFDVEILYQAAVQVMHTYRNGGKVETDQLIEPLPSHCLYIGLEVAGDIENLGGLTLYFDKLPIHKHKLLPLFRFFHKDVQIETAMGLPVYTDARLPYPDAEYLRLRRIQKQILSAYEAKFCHFKNLAISSDFADNPRVNALTPLLPEQGDGPRIIWIEVRLPDGLTADDLAALEIRANCFPVWNACLVRQRGAYPGGTAIIPLATDEKKTEQSFLGVQRVWSDTHVFGPSEFTMPGCPSYHLQSGYIGAFNREELARRTDSLLHTMEAYGLTDLVVFAAEHAYEIGYENLAEVLTRLKLDIAHLKKQLEGAPYNAKRRHYYLHLKGAGKELVYLDYWVTQGALTSLQLWPFELNLIPGEYETTPLKKAALLESPSGGREALSPSACEALIRNKLAESFNQNQAI